MYWVKSAPITNTRNYIKFDTSEQTMKDLYIRFIPNQIACD